MFPRLQTIKLRPLSKPRWTSKHAQPTEERKVIFKFPSILHRQVEWAHQDVFNHVNNKVYFAWMESGRIDYMEKLGLSSMTTDGPSIILAETSCLYQKPVNFPDRVAIKTRTSYLGKTSWILETEIVRSDGEVAATGTSRCVFYNYSLHEKIPCPGPIREKMAALEKIE